MMIIAVWDGSGTRHKRVKHLFHNTQREKAFCGYQVKDWQNPNLTIAEWRGHTAFVCTKCVILANRERRLEDSQPSQQEKE